MKLINPILIAPLFLVILFFFLSGGPSQGDLLKAKSFMRRDIDELKEISAAVLAFDDDRKYKVNASEYSFSFPADLQNEQYLDKFRLKLLSQGWSPKGSVNFYCKQEALAKIQSPFDFPEGETINRIVMKYDISSIKICKNK